MASPTASARAPGGPIVFQATSTPRRELSASSSTSMSDRLSDRPFEDDVENVRREDRPQEARNGQRCHRTEITSYHDRAASLSKMDLVPLKELGQFIGSTENGTEYQQLVSESFKGARINVHSTKEGQLAIARLGSSSDTVVRDLVEIVSDQAQLDHVLTLLPPMQRQLLAVRRKADAHSRPPLSHCGITSDENLERRGASALQSHEFKRLHGALESRTTQFGKRSAREGHRFFQAIPAGGQQAGNWRGEVRQWTMVSDKLVPRQKRRRIFEELGNRSHDSQDNHDGLSEGISVASVEL
ncbi:unnamed protein product [Heligmosomoides polygyrus]|uniref:KH_dom_type_1 domain-containing protein n=1 Tax=Heligmosomoides polygyrus TaxID=6339 RepID=A0A183FL02_HELPZ|nr:unnamed protein product [Heligmosomoides polygyrus]